MALSEDEEAFAAVVGRLGDDEDLLYRRRALASLVVNFAASAAGRDEVDRSVVGKMPPAPGVHGPEQDDGIEDLARRHARPYLDAARAAGDANLYKHYWELCVLFALQGGLRSGEIWVRGSRRYADPASYLIAVEVRPAKRAEVMELTKMPATFAERLTAIDAETSRYLDDLEALLGDPNSPVSVDAGGQLHLKALSAEVIDPEVLAQRDAVARLPRVPLTSCSARSTGRAGSPPT